MEATNAVVINVDALDTIENVEPNVTPPGNIDGTEAPQDFDLKEVTKDLKETVNNIEAKCAGVREELGQMAMSEQYMRTKQAQLLAKRREKEADVALEAASKKEQEAQVNFLTHKYYLVISILIFTIYKLLSDNFFF